MGQKLPRFETPETQPRQARRRCSESAGSSLNEDLPVEIVSTGLRSLHIPMARARLLPRGEDAVAGPDGALSTPTRSRRSSSSPWRPRGRGRRRPLPRVRPRRRGRGGPGHRDRRGRARRVPRPPRLSSRRARTASPTSRRRAGRGDRTPRLRLTWRWSGTKEEFVGVKAGGTRRRLAHGEAQGRQVTNAPGSFSASTPPETSGFRRSVVSSRERLALATECVFEEGLIHGVALAPGVGADSSERPGSASARTSTSVAVGYSAPAPTPACASGSPSRRASRSRAGSPSSASPPSTRWRRTAPRGPERRLCARDARREVALRRVYRDGGAWGGDLRLVPPRPRSATRPPAGGGARPRRRGGALRRSSFQGTGGPSATARPLDAARRSTVAGSASRLRGVGDPMTTFHDLAPVYLRLSEAEERLREKGCRK